MSINIDKQIEYWQNGANEDIVTAELLINGNRLLPGLFFCHLVIEKILKAHVVKSTKEIPPRTHNLSWLLDKTPLVLAEKDKQFLGILMHYQLEGRYPDYNPEIPSKPTVLKYLQHTKSLLECLEQQL